MSNRNEEDNNEAASASAGSQDEGVGGQTLEQDIDNMTHKPAGNTAQGAQGTYKNDGPTRMTSEFDKSENL
ncbi:MAG: hypothetical protein WCD76_06500 [Pyrinomonadaceae bacterium]